MTPRRRSQIVPFLAVMATALTACSPTGADEGPTARIAFLQDLSVPDHVDLVSPSFLAFDMAVQRRVDDLGLAVEVVQLDTGGVTEASIEMATQVAEDPSFVLAVAAPFWDEPPEVARILAEAGVPTISLSPVSASPWTSDPSLPGDPVELWRRLVPDQAAEAELIADIAGRGSRDVAGRTICLVSDGSPYGIGAAGSVEAALGHGSSTAIDGSQAISAASDVETSGCRIVIWAGFPPGARALARAMRDAGSARGRPVDLAGDALKTTIPPTSPAGEGVVVGSVACPCADVSTELDLASRRFVNAYQSRHGLPPGVYAAEAWDAGDLAGRVISSDGTRRAAMRTAFGSLISYEGVARTYDFDAQGELAGASAGLFVATGTRWLPLPS
jgi:ABC-type branched-subunit amino acid transport system substrate-binding protein